MNIEQSEKRREVTRQRGPNLVYYMLHIHIFRVLRNISAKEKVMKRRSRIQEKSSFDTIEKGEVIHKLSSPSPVLNPKSRGKGLGLGLKASLHELASNLCTISRLFRRLFKQLFQNSFFRYPSELV